MKKQWSKWMRKEIKNKNKATLRQIIISLLGREIKRTDLSKPKR